MRNHISHALILLAISLSVVSCDLFFDIVLPTDPSVFVINQNSERVEVGPEAMEHSVYIASDMTWNAILKQGTWCRLKQQTYYNEFTSTLIFEVDANTSTESRMDSLIVVSGAQRKSLAIIQYGTAGVIDASEIVLYGKLPVQYQFKASGYWNASKTGDWFSISPTSGRGNTVITIQALDDNQNLEEHTGKISFAMNGVTVDIPVRQRITETLIVNETEVSVEGNGGEFSIGTQTNVEYGVSIDVPWITENTTKSLLELTHSFIAEPNPSAESRVAHITFTYEDIYERVNVVQQGRSPILDISTPGVYGITGEDIVYLRLVCQSACVHKGETRDFRLMTPSRNMAVLLEDVPEELEQGKWMHLPLSIFQNGKAIYARPVDVAKESEDDNLIWLKTASPSGFIVIKKQ